MVNQKKCSTNKYLIKFIYHNEWLFHLTLTQKLLNQNKPILINKYKIIPFQLHIFKFKQYFK